MNKFAMLVLIPAMVSGALWTIAQDRAQIERGQYLVEEVARCSMCHTPHDERGQEDSNRRLQGATIWFEPVRRIQDWAYSAPTLAGLPAFTQEEAIRVLETGLTPEGRKVRPPMHAYHMRREDAAAIVAYLRSLKPPLR
jgi:mono/diheme cytochrome c family protein